MARNAIQFQKGISLTDFLKNYGTEEQCFQALFHWRWSKGFVCPHCGHDRACLLTVRRLQQCYRCHRQTSVTAGTIFSATKLPLTVWFLALYLLTQSKKGISAMQLHRELGISYDAAWRIKHKLMQVMMERDDKHQLEGLVQIDDAYLGGERSGGKRGRGAAAKTPFLAAVQTNDQGHPLRMKLSVIKGFRSSEVAAWARRHLADGTAVCSDGLPCFNALSEAGFEHQVVVTGGGKASVQKPEFHWVNTMLGNVKSAIRSIHHSVSGKYAHRYLAAFEYRFNRRFQLPDLIPRLAYVALRTPPMPDRLLKLGLI